MIRFITFFLIALVLIIALYPFVTSIKSAPAWKFRSIDTMKYSRDMAREKLHDSAFDAVIEEQIASIAKTGATHVAIATPYDEEFLSFLQRWVRAARRHNLKIWYRGNFSGWEQWFGYESISRDQHISMTKVFIEKNAILFQDGDVFSSCPECENGEKLPLHEPRVLSQYRTFLLSEYAVTKEAFARLGKKVHSNYYSMNGTVASLLMDKETTAAFDGVVVVDHYVKDPQILADDIRTLAKNSGGKIILGEFGAPIPDLHGAMNEEEQAVWIEEVLTALVHVEALEGINYWVNVGGSTAAWHTDGTPKPAATVLGRFFSGNVSQGKVINDSGMPIRYAHIQAGSHTVLADKHGVFTLPYIKPDTKILFSAPRYTTKEITASSLKGHPLIMLEEKKGGLLQSLFFFR